MKRILTALAFFAVVALPAFSQDSDAERARLQKEITMLDKQIKTASAKSSNALNTLSLTQKKLENSRKLYNGTLQEVKTLQKKIQQKQTRINEAQRQLDTMEVHFEALVRSVYKNRDPHLWYMYLLSGDSISQSVRRFSYLKNLSSVMQADAAELMAQRDSLTAQKRELETLMAASRQLLARQNDDVQRLKADEKKNREVVNRLQKEKSKYQQQLALKKKQVSELNAKLGEAVKSSYGKQVRSAVDAKLSSQFVSNKGRLPWPVNGVIIESYGQHNHPVYKNVKLPFNNGVTISVASNEPVKAVFDGTVRQVILMPGYNQCVLVQHGDYFTFYCKLRMVSVKAGDKVRTGQKIGLVDTIGGATQLHFQLWKGRSPQNPELWLSR